MLKKSPSLQTNVSSEIDYEETDEEKSLNAILKKFKNFNGKLNFYKKIT